MIRLLSDENFKRSIARGLLLRRPGIDLARVQDVGLLGVADPDILDWAARNDRILLTHDRRTIPDFAFARCDAGQPMPGVFVVGQRSSIRRVIEDLV
jgi:predicted nuclease of predicted toxin-antitoxin system